VAAPGVILSNPNDLGFVLIWPVTSAIFCLALAGTAWLLLVVKLDQILRIRFSNPQ
jgi:hypothetical protein